MPGDSNCSVCIPVEPSQILVIQHLSRNRLSVGYCHRRDGCQRGAAAVQQRIILPGLLHLALQNKTIDFQDALQGPVPYDLVALLCDSYVALDAELQEAMIARYAAARGLDLAPFRALFWRQALQRKLKDAGRFVYIDRVRANPGFLPSFGPSLVYVGRALTELGAELGDEAEEVRAILTRRLPGFPDTVPTPLAATGENA